ncbi:Coiled-coil domain-containing protein 42-like [Oopsacas minuta]|uniref:Coiled-coil domain-containing protein 42-like n=1 Tax=Oopsacas minuta TaxID=111878 RepID=A0AAV7KBL0_9METZ|nr:Coiled-coil domain-containing protein 42-like [Oopsacas minuta]
MTGTELDDYFRTTFEQKMLIKMPDREEDHLLPATRLLDKRRKILEVDNALAAQRDDFKMKLEALRQRKEELERREKQLKDTLQMYDKYLKEDEMKRERATLKIKHEAERIAIKDKEIIELEKERDELIEVIRDQKQKIADNLKYKEYLQKVVKHSPEEFSEIGDIISRYETLSSTHNDLLKKDIANQEALETARANLKKFNDEKNNEILNCTNQVSSLQANLEQARNLLLQRESEWNTIQTTAAEKTLLLGQIKMSTHNLFSHIRKYKGDKHSDKEVDTIAQLDKIKEFIQDMTIIVAEVTRADQLEQQKLQPQQQGEKEGMFPPINKI